MMGGVMQTLIPVFQHRVCNRLCQRGFQRLAAAQHKVFIERILTVRDTNNGTLARQLQRVRGELISESFLFA